MKTSIGVINRMRVPLFQQRGTSMLEILASILIFSIGMLGYAAVQTRSLKESFDLNQRTIALWQSQEVIDRIRANRTAIDTYISKIGDFDCADSDDLPAKMCSDSHTVTTESGCTTIEAATFDSWDVICNNPSSTIDSAAVDYTPIDHSISLVCTTANSPCPLTDGLILSYSWTSKATDDDENVSDASTIETQQYVVDFMP